MNRISNPSFEQRIQQELAAQKAAFYFEPFAIPYPRNHHYVPDIVLANGIIVELKGEFTSADRKKHRLIKAQYPALDIRFVFADPNRLIGKKSSTTYARWCALFGFRYAAMHIPNSWLQEPSKDLAPI
ncbi:MAG: endodeoxyribonuclease [Oligoflexales bacterium]